MTTQYSVDSAREGPHLLPLRLREERFGDVITPIPAGEESAIRDGVNVAALAAASTMI